MSSPGSVAGDDRLRLFLALQLPDPVVEALADWQSRHLRGSMVPGSMVPGRIVPAANLHVTLAFLGSRPARELESICAVLEETVLGEAAAAVAPPQLDVGRYRETRSAGMLLLSDRTRNGARLAARLHEELAALGLFEQERRPWLPHVTVLRYRERPRFSPPPPELPAFAPSDAAAYLSRLRPSGSRSTGPEYVVLKSFPLGG